MKRRLLCATLLAGLVAGCRFQAPPMSGPRRCPRIVEVTNHSAADVEVYFASDPRGAGLLLEVVRPGQSRRIMIPRAGGSLVAKALSGEYNRLIVREQEFGPCDGPRPPLR